MMGARAKASLYLLLVAAIAFSVAIDTQLERFGPWKAAACWLVVAGVAASSWPRYRSQLVAQIAASLTLLVVTNLLLSPLVPVLAGNPPPTLPLNQVRKFRVVGDVMVGFSEWHTYTSDGRGHRTNGPIDYADKPPDVLRIAFFGASTTEEAELDDRKTWSAQVGQAVEVALQRKVEIVNTAVQGTRAPQQLAALKASATYAPDLAIFLMGINDWNHAIVRGQDNILQRAMRTFSAFAFSRSLLYQGAIRLYAGLVGAVHGPSDEVEIEDGSFYADHAAVAARQPEIAFRPAAVDTEYAEAVEAIFAECRRRALPCLFVEQPTAYDPATGDKSRFWMTPPYRRYAVRVADLRALADLYNGWLKKAATGAGFPFCPTVPQIPATTAAFFDDCHFTENGARMVAALVSACVLENPTLRGRLR